MALWSSNEKDLRGEVNDKTKIEKNGVYELKIKEAFIQDSAKSKARAITISFENEEVYGKMSLWFLKGDGTENKFAQAKLNRLLFLCKTKVENLKEEVKKVKLFSGEEIDRTFLPDLQGKEIGMILLAKTGLNTNGDPTVNLEVFDFFDIKSQKTSGEIKDNKPATVVAKKRKEFEEIPQEEKIAYTTDKNIVTTNSLDDDEFPF